MNNNYCKTTGIFPNTWMDRLAAASLLIFGIVVAAGAVISTAHAAFYNISAEKAPLQEVSPNLQQAVTPSPEGLKASTITIGPFDGRILDIRFAPTGNIIAVSTSTNSIYVVDIVGQKIIQKIDPSILNPEGGYCFGCMRVDLSSDGKLGVVEGGGNWGIWSVEDGKLLLMENLDRPGYSGFFIRFSRDGSLFTIGQSTDSINPARTYRTRDGKPMEIPWNMHEEGYLFTQEAPLLDYQFNYKTLTMQIYQNWGKAPPKYSIYDIHIPRVISDPPGEIIYSETRAKIFKNNTRIGIVTVYGQSEQSSTSLWNSRKLQGIYEIWNLDRVAQKTFLIRFPVIQDNLTAIRGDGMAMAYSSADRKVNVLILKK